MSQLVPSGTDYSCSTDHSWYRVAQIAAVAEITAGTKWHRFRCSTDHSWYRVVQITAVAQITAGTEWHRSQLVPSGTDLAQITAGTQWHRL